MDVLAAFVAIVIVHELGHVIAARLCGVPLAGIVVGAGPLVRQWQTSGFVWRLRLLPLGVCVAFPQSAVIASGSMRRIALCGPLAGLLLVPVALALSMPTLATLALIINLYNLLPFPGSDGMQAIRR